MFSHSSISSAKLAKIVASKKVQGLMTRDAADLVEYAKNLQSSINEDMALFADANKHTVTAQTQVIAALLALGANVPADLVGSACSVEALEFFAGYSDADNVNTWIKALAALS